MLEPLTHEQLEALDLRVLAKAPDAAEADVLARLRAPGEVLKASRKALVRRVGDWVVKEQHAAAFGAPAAPFRRRRLLRTWRTAEALHNAGVAIPAPIACVEGPAYHAIVYTFLEGMENVEVFVRRAVAEGDHEQARALLAALAEAVAKLNAVAYHADLSGKNIFTTSDLRLHFIDIDAATIGKKHTRRRRMRNLVQLYDSFCDMLAPDELRPLIHALTPPHWDAGATFEAVQKGQQARRATLMRRREKHAG